MLEGANIKIFEVRLKKLFLFYLWVFLCAQVGENDTQVFVKEGSIPFHRENKAAIMLLLVKC